ncbi:NUMOD4 domain-containing protein [Fictibacillus phosphorivorans]|uniref:NUMOD4 domain-containing protein n=1 Tax=Fictibacillus phosphorivorans TaxID=1221500 RepID=UPI003CE9F28B
MDEIRRSIKDFEEQYYITESGRIISKKNNKVRLRSGNEYGYANVHLHKNGIRELHKTYNLWRDAFPELSEKVYKGLK